MTRYRPKDHSEYGNNDSTQESDPKCSSKEKFPDIRFTNSDRSEWGLFATPTDISTETVLMRERDRRTVSDRPMNTIRGSKS